MDSPEGNPISATSSPDSPSLAVQESPFFHYLNNLSPIKSVKTVNYAQRFSKNILPTPSPVFTSPRIDVQRETIFQRSRNNSQGTNVCIQYQTRGEVVPSSSFDKEVELCSSSGCLDEYLLEPVDRNDWTGPSDLYFPSGTNLLKLLPKGFSGPKESKSKTSLATEGNMELGTETVAIENKANFPDPLRLVETAIDFDCGNDERLTDFDEFLDKKFAHLFESPMNLDPLSMAKDGKILQFVESFEYSDLTSRAGSSRINKVAVQHQRGIRRHLQFEPKNASETSPACGNCVPKQEFSSLAFPKNVSESLILSQSETPRITGKWPTSIFEDTIDCGSSLSPLGMVNSTQNLDDSTNPVVPCGIGLHLNSIATRSCMSSGKMIVSNLHLVEGKFEHVSEISQAKKENTFTSWGGAENVCLRGINEQQECQPGLEVTPYERKTLDSQNLDMMELEPNKVSSKKKRKKPASTSENNCNHCNCKRSKCLKLYCECFAAGIFCVDSCACENCFNKPIYEETVFDVRKQIETRNPLAFAPKVVNSSLDSPATAMEEGNGTTPSSARHKRGCNCKKSKCLKKYCECYQGSVGCSDGCRCEVCQNPYGTKTENRTENREKNLSNNKADFQQDNIAAQVGSANCSAPRKVLSEITNVTPLAASPTRLLGTSNIQSLGIRSHQWQYSPISFKPWLQGCKTTQEPISEECLHDINDDGTPEISNLSPNKNFLPYFQSEGQSSTSQLGLITGRKIILQAVPSFPSLTPYKDSDGGFNQAESSENGRPGDQ